VRSLVRDLVAVELAIWFHDAVYDPRGADNEERSAALAENWLTAVQANKTLIHAVCQLVLATKRHDISRYEDAPVLVDVDLSILGQPPERFWEYEHQIREEYRWVPADVFAARRAEILEGFLARPRIFATAIFSHRLEAQARVNLRAAVARLRG